MTRQERLSMKPNYTMVYHKDIGCHIQMVLLEITNEGLYRFSLIEDVLLPPEEVEDFLVIIQL